MEYKKAKKIIIEEIYRLYELNMLDTAEDIAQFAHLRQKRKREGQKPYIIHPKRVQLLAKALGYDVKIQVICLLHDAIEDSKNPEYYINLIKNKFGIEVLNAVLLLTHDKDVPYNDYLEKLASGKGKISQNAFKVKILDMYNNITDAPSSNQKIKYKNAIQNLVDKNLADDVPEVLFKILDVTPVQREMIVEAPKDKPKSDSKDTSEPSKDSSTPDTDTGNDTGDSSPSDTGEDAGEGTGDDMGTPPPSGAGSGGGGGSFGGEDDILGDEPGGEDKPPEDGANAGDENSIVKYNDKLNKSKVIQFQRTTELPDFNFEYDNDFYKENLLMQTGNGSLLIAVPNSTINSDIDFLKKVVIPKIIKAAYNAVKSGKEVVLMGDYGLPYYDGKYSNTASGMIAKVLNELFKNTISFDTWNPKDFEGFISNKEIWNELKARTETKNSEIKAALYLFLLATGREEELIKKLKSSDVVDTLLKWELPAERLNMQLHKDEILRTAFPDKYGNSETTASYIIKMYLQLLKVNMLKKVIEYEKKGKVVIVPADLSTTWSIGDSFKKLDKLIVKKEPKKADTKNTGTEQSPESNPKDIEKKETPNDQSQEKQ